MKNKIFIMLLRFFAIIIFLLGIFPLEIYTKNVKSNNQA